MVDIHTREWKDKHEIVMKLTISVGEDPTLEEVLAAVKERFVELKVFRNEQ